MIKVQSFMIQPLFKSFIPLLVGGSYHLLKGLFQSGWSNGSLFSGFFESCDMKQNLFEPQVKGASAEADFVTLLDQISFGVYTNLLAFLFVMLSIDVLFEIVGNGVKDFWKEVKSSRARTLSSDYSAREWRLFNLISENQIKRIFSYAAIFMILQMIGLCLSLIVQIELSPGIKSHPAVTSSQGLDAETFSQINLMNQQGVSRVLEEELDEALLQEPSFAPSMTSDRISLSMGNVLSSLSLNVNSMILSKDKKIAFVTIDYSGTLYIIDISDLKSPYVMSSLNWELSTPDFRLKSLVLSLDEKTLYISNSKDLKIIDVTDPSFPKLISLTKSEIFWIDDVYEVIPSQFKPTLAVSESTKTLYIGGLGLEVYDISDPKKPVFLKGFKNDMTPKGIAINEICLSRDGEILFIVNGTLDIFNVSNPREMKQLYSLKTKSSLRSIMFSEDFRTAFLLGTDTKNEIIFEEVDISSYHSLKILNTVPLGHQSTNSPRFLAISPSRSKFFIFAEPADFRIDVLIFDRLKQTIRSNGKGLIEETFTMDFALDGKTLITGSNGQFMTIELFLDYPNRQIFSPSQDHFIDKISLPTFIQEFQMSADGQYLFILRLESSEDFNDNHIFEILDLKSPMKPTVLSSYDCLQEIRQMHLTKDKKTVYLLSETSISVLDIRNPSSISLKKTLKAGTSEDIKFKHFIASSDEKTGFLVMTVEDDEFGFVSFLDLSKPSGVADGFVKLNMPSKSVLSRLVLKDEDKTLIVLNREMTIYNISNLLSPIHIATTPFGVNESEQYVRDHVLSPDNKVLYLETFDINHSSKLKIYNLSILTSPQLVSEKFLSRSFSKAGFSLSSDLKSGFFLRENDLIKLNLTNLKQPKISGIIPLTKNEEDPDNSRFLLSPDGQTIYVGFGSEILRLNMNIQYTMFLKQEKFMLGEKYSDNIALLNLTGKSDSDYNLVDTGSYKITKLSLMDIKANPKKEFFDITTSLLPSWITFDRESNVLTVESKKQHNIGTYTLHSVFSLKIPREVFDDIGTAENPVSSEDLVAWLISLDYVDPQLYLTANFRSFDTFYLPSNFSSYRRDIYNILKKYHIETCTLFDIVPSLQLENVNGERIVVSTLSTNNIKVDISLEAGPGVETRFVNRPYGSLIPVMKDTNKTKIYLEGSVKEINAALNSIIVNFENGTESDANVVINDGLNLPVPVALNNISRYFKANKPPRVNHRVDKTVQEQIDSANIQTGTYFTFTLSEDSFEDDFAESLDYDFAMTKNNTAFPSWLSFDGLTLKGTPPEEILGRDLDLILIAKNEFKQNQIPFKLHISISVVFWLKLILRYSPYILTLIGLFVSANKIFNILRKDFYKHSKEFHIGVGEEISENVIFPISFIKEERKQSQLIWKQFRDINVKVTDFIGQDGKVIEKEKVISKIKEVLQKMPVNMKKQITLYPSPIIDQIIFNKFVWMQLDSAKETQTRSLFENLKADCLEVVERDGSSASGFTIDQNKLDKLMKRVKMSAGERNESLTLEESLLIDELDVPEGVNMSLLKDAILTFAFENHSVDISPVDLDIEVKQKVPSNIIFKFLKLDLRDIYLDYKNKMNYGLNYQIIDDKLCFYGIAQNYFKGKTIAIQIKNQNHKIMKEIWIHGVSPDFQKDEIFMIRDEQEMRGQGYEIY